MNKKQSKPITKRATDNFLFFFIRKNAHPAAANTIPRRPIIIIILCFSYNAAKNKPSRDAMQKTSKPPRGLVNLFAGPFRFICYPHSIKNVIKTEWLRAIGIPNFRRFLFCPRFKAEFLHHTQLVHFHIVWKMCLISIRLKALAWEIITLVTKIDALFPGAEEYLTRLLRVQERDIAFLKAASLACGFFRWDTKGRHQFL